MGNMRHNPLKRKAYPRLSLPILMAQMTAVPREWGFKVIEPPALPALCVQPRLPSFTP